MNRRDLFKLAGKVGLVALAQQVPWGWIERAGLLGEYMAEAATLPPAQTSTNAASPTARRTASRARSSVRASPPITASTKATSSAPCGTPLAAPLPSMIAASS